MHPDNTLNELSGEEWLYFTKSLWTTAYPSELGHAARKAHGANKPPRLMAKLIEFFTKPGELVLDPFAGVGGTLLGASICRSPRRALGFEIEPRWETVYESVVADQPRSQNGDASWLADLGTSDPGGPRSLRSVGRPSSWSATRWQLLAGLERGVSRLRGDRSAVQPAAQADDGRRRLAEAVRQPTHRLRDGHVRSGRPREQRHIRGVPRPDGRACSAGLRRVLREERYAT